MGEAMKGRLAFSRAGHDKGKLYLIVRQEGERVWLADGRTRSVQDPKEKNRKHIQPAGQEFSEEEVASFFENPAWADNRIRETIDIFQRQKEAQESRTECKQP